MKIRKVISILHLQFIVLLFIGYNLTAQNNSSQQYPDGLVGHWTFDNPSNLTEATVGNSLVLHGNHIAVEGIDDLSGGVRIGIESYYSVLHEISSNGGGSLVNKYTIVMDIKIPSTGLYYALYQTNPSNIDDGDWFVSTSSKIGIGNTGYSEKALRQDEWYRIALVISNGLRHEYYIDGKKVHTGAASPVDGRFALSSKVLFFADENGEDNLFDIADIKIFSHDLSDSEISELGGIEHEFVPIKNIALPYLQSPTSSSIYVCWSNIGDNPTVEYGLTESLGKVVTPEIIQIDDGEIYINWFAGKLENLQSSTTYYYKVKTDSTESQLYKFRTQPADSNSTEHIRFAVYGDNRTVPTKFKEVSDSLMNKVKSLYGENLEEDLNLIFNVGDIVTHGKNLSEYLPEYFNPIDAISCSVPYMVSIGNHEGEASHYYNFMKYENFGGAEGEKYYSFRIGKVLFIGLNSNNGLRTDTQINWLNEILTNAQNNNSIEWIFAFLHHPGHSELWPDGNNSYVQNRIIPTLVKYSKVDMLTYGHSHNYERGTAINGNFRLMLNGGAGSALDRWEMYNNQENYPEIQKTLDHYCYSIIDIDVANKSMEVVSYSLGTPEQQLDNIVIDRFFRNKKNEIPPTVPILTLPIKDEVSLPFKLKADYNGTYEIMRSHFQVTTTQGNFDLPIIDVQTNYEDMYGKPQAPDYKPTDLNAAKELTEYVLPASSELSGKIWARVRYRDINLQWSDWSKERAITITNPTGIKENNVAISDYKLYYNYPNPFNPTTTIQFDLKETSFVTLRVYNALGQLVKELENRKLSSGKYNKIFDASSLSSGIYYYKLKANNFVKIRKMSLVK